jgi:lysine 2,3-aminomutase
MEDNVCLTQETEPPGRMTGSAGTAQVELIENLIVPPFVESVAPSKEKNLYVIPSRGAGATCKPSIRSSAFKRKYFPEATMAQWNDWKWQLNNRIMDMESLAGMIWLSEEEYNALLRQDEGIPLSITPYYASLLDSINSQQPLRKSVVPIDAEHEHSRGESMDPLSEEEDSPVPGIVHRYPDRVLFLVTNFCSTYCRYCTRPRLVGKGEVPELTRKQWRSALDYIRSTPQIRDVLLSGGDPLTLSDEALNWLLSEIRDIPHVELVRIGTKVPAVLPQRITAGLVHVLKRYHPLWMSIHFTHPDELTYEVNQACCRLADAGIPLGSQTVLLSGVNDDVETMTKLFQGLLVNRVRPYYLYQCDPVLGSSHFRTPIERGLEIISGLRGHTTGYAVPTYVIDAPGGGGKIPLLPNAVVDRDDDYIMLKNYEGRIYRYPDSPKTSACRSSSYSG